MHSKKRGVAAAPALIAIITLLIILYVLLLPATDRQRLIGPGPYDSGVVSLAIENKSVLNAYPGTIDVVQQTEVEHFLPAVNVFTKTEGVIIGKEDSVYTKNALFTDIKKNFSFNVEDLENTNNALLNFIVDEGNRMLVISLNGQEITNNEFKKKNIDPIKIKKELLVEGVNTITFESESPGFAFWRVNEYDLDKVTVTADVTKTETRVSETKFIMDSEEKNNLKRARIKFSPDCDLSKVGKLTVKLNGNQIFSGVPDCGSRVIQEFLPDYLSTGENSLVFEAESGNYFIDLIGITSELKKPRDFIYDFIIDAPTFDAILDQSVHATLVLKFADEEFKKADIIVNGHITHVTTKDFSYERMIDPYINEGDNYIRIIPKTSMFMPELKVLITG